MEFVCIFVTFVQIYIKYCASNHLEHGAVKDGFGHNDKYYDYCDEFDVFCEEMTKGKIWLGFGITALVLGLIAWFGLLRELRADSKPIAMIPMILFSVICILNVIVYLTASEGLSQCGDNACGFLNGNADLGYECSSTWGLSLIFMLIAGVLAVFSTIFTAIINYD